MRIDYRDTLVLLRYHVWAYEQIYISLDQVDEDKYRQDAGIFFKSIHGTLNHLLLVEQLWFSRIIGSHFEVASLSDEIEMDRAKLQATIITVAKGWLTYVENSEVSLLDGIITYQNTQKITRTFSLKAILIHVVNHATHHRGQISAAMSHLGYEVPVMDLAYFDQAMKPELRDQIGIFGADETEFILALFNNDNTALHTRLSAGEDPNQKSKLNYPALHVACIANNTKAVRLLLLYGADKEQRDRNNFRAIDLAYFNHNEQLVHVLREHGVNTSLFSQVRRRRHSFSSEIRIEP